MIEQTLPRTAWTAAEIMSMRFPEPRWAVPGVVAEGVTLLAGAPKIGKSWLSLNISTAVALGGKALGRVDVDCGDVLYLALEDNPRRLQSRLGKVLSGSVAPDRLTFAVHCEPLPAGGTERISAWLETHPDARLVVVDVFARVRGSAPANMSSYDADYLAMGALKRLADRYGVAILVVHHTRKAASEDFLDAVSGTNGLAGSADAVLVLKRSRGKAAAELHVTGRDVEEAEYALDFDPRLGAWQMLDGPASDYSLGDTRRAILDHLRVVGSGTPRQIADALALNYETAKKTCKRMFDDDQLDTDGGGTYFTPSLSVPPVPGVPEKYGDGDGGDARDTPIWEESA
ncbi:AAA family ATPase [Nocardioides caldifontis]|uniref:AAA family ATPase n=1 Tax=Nocardioides caldifontis TaxID=2588938 RepID=UPI00193ABFF8|nr:AAA family ATPase [Nocardioides caldifontis]